MGWWISVSSFPYHSAAFEQFLLILVCRYFYRSGQPKTYWLGKGVCIGRQTHCRTCVSGTAAAASIICTTVTIISVAGVH